MAQRKRVPRFWWDFDDDMGVIIETDIRRELVRAPNIPAAEQMLAALTAGRICWKDLAREDFAQ